jgi:hypothetical protein
MILAFKLIVTPLFIGSVTLAGRRWGPVVSGLMMGLPLTSGPISLFLAIQYGGKFAAQAAVGSLAGEASVCVFCLAYSLAARKSSWPFSAFIALTAFLVTTLIWNHFSWLLISAFIVLLVIIGLVARLIPHNPRLPKVTSPPAWDLPARMVIAALFVLLLTTIANALGPQLSGLLSPFPVFGVVLASFTHSQQGAQAASNLLRGVVLGSLSFASFFLVVGMFLTQWGPAWTYPTAALVAILVGGLLYFLTRSAAR